MEKMNERKRRRKKRFLQKTEVARNVTGKKNTEKMNSGESDLKTRSQFKVVCSCVPMVE